MHRSILLVAPLALAACSSSPEGNAAATPTPHVSAAPATAPAAAQTATDTHASPKPGALKTFGAWEVGCDNSHACTMASLGPENGDFPPINLTLARTAGPEGAVTVTLLPNDGLAPKTAPTSVAIDGKTVGGAFGGGETPSVTGDAATSIATTMANRHALVIRGGGGATLATLSLKGASAALRYIDAEQGRAGSVTAVVAKGNAPAATVPAGPALPQIVAIAPVGKPFAPNAAMVATMRKTAQCDDSAQGDPEGYPLGGGATLILLPCSSGAYNMISAVFVAQDGKAAPARMDAPSGFTEDGAPAAVPMVVNAAFSDGVLTSYAKGRGLGDCGVRQAFVWDGATFRLSHQVEMGECRGDPNYIPTWVTKVSRR